MHKIRNLAHWSASLMATGLILASSAAHGAEEEAGETVIIDGNPIADACAEQWGPAYEEVVDGQGNLEGCSCKFGMESECDQGEGFGWADDVDPPLLGGGGGGDGADECNDGSCECTIEDPEPEVCGNASCADCDSELDECVSEAVRNVDRCVGNNRKIAQATCRVLRPRGLSEAQCISYETNGTPGITTGSTDTNKEEKTKDFRGGVDWGWGSFGTGYSSTSGSSHSDSLSIHYPPKPVDRNTYADCEQQARMEASLCAVDAQLCYEDAEAEGDETCER